LHRYLDVEVSEIAVSVSRLQAGSPSTSDFVPEQTNYDSIMTQFPVVLSRGIDGPNGHTGTVDLAHLGANLDVRPDRSEGAIWTACWRMQAQASWHRELSSAGPEKGRLGGF
jgi:hypothetical protein